MWISTILRTLAAGIQAQSPIDNKRKEGEDKTDALFRDVHQELCKLNNTLARIESQVKANDRVEKRDLHIQEYLALRAEQRGRLDSANKIIHYYAVVIAALILGLLNAYRGIDNIQSFNIMLQNILLLLPAISMPFAFAQQNEEIIVRNIGDYFRDLKGMITFMGDTSYWGWEDRHNQNKAFILLFTSGARSVLLIAMAMLSLIIYVVDFKFKMNWWQGALFALDCTFVILGLVVAITMSKRRFRGM